MTFRIQICAFVLILGIARALIADVSSENDPNMAFAFANLQGDSLLLLQFIPHPEELSVAICSQGQKFTVHYEGKQNGNRNATSFAETAENFENDEGDLFKIVNGKTIADDICFLSADELLLDDEPLAINSSNNSRCGQEIIQDVENSRSRRVVNCWQLAEIQYLGEVFLSKFERNQVDAIASIVLNQNQGLALYDFQADLFCDGVTWRVDDDGALHPESFHILFALRENSDSIYIAIVWDGAEGQDLWLLQWKDNCFELVLDGYRYWVV